MKSAGALRIVIVASESLQPDAQDAEAWRIAERSRLLGFTGSPCIHPSQVPLFNDAFGVAEAAYQEAERIVTVYGKALAEGLGAVALDGKMIDIPVYVRARQTKARAELGR